MIKEAAAERKKATQLKGKDKNGKPIGGSVSVSQLIDTPIDPNDNRTDAVLAKAYNTNRGYVGKAKH